MLRWNDIHPYNAVHIVHVQQKLDRERLRCAITREIRDLGLGSFIIDRVQGTYAFADDTNAIELRFLAAADEVTPVLSQLVEAELNRPFSNRMLSPFRFFVVEETEAFYLGLVYFHAVAGAESVAFLMNLILNRYMEREHQSCSLPLDLYFRPSVLKRTVRPSLMVGQLRLLMRHVANVRRSCRPNYRDMENHRNAFFSFVIQEERFHQILAKAKQWGVTLNDFFLAGILWSLSPLAWKRLKAQRRRLLSAGSIANIRKDLMVEESRTFGLFLGSFIVSHEVLEDITLEALARDLQRQTSQIKKYKTYLFSLLELKAAEVLIPYLSGGEARFYAKNFPLWAGITNMNLNAIWARENRNEVTDYLRIVSTGPVTPCVFAITTLGQRINVGVSYRTAVYSPVDMQEIVCRFQGIIEETVCRR